MRKKNKFLSLFIAVSVLFTTCISSISKTALATERDLKSVVIDVTDYGADPSGKTDSAVAIWDAFEAAKQATADGATSVTVDFPKGEYHVYKDYAQKREYHTSNTDSTTYPVKTIGILIEDQSNFTLEGNGSLFMMHGNMMALAVVKSENVKLHNFAWDFAVPTVSEMTVMSMGIVDGKDYVDYYIPSCFQWEIEGNTIRWDSEKSPYTGELYWQEWGIHRSYSVVAHSPESETSKSYLNNQGVFEAVNKIEKIDENTVRFKYNNRNENQKKPIELGAVFQFVSSAVRETAGAFIWESSDILIEDIDVHFMHGFGWLTQMSNNVHYKNCNFTSREGTGRYAMSYADGIHASGASGDFIIEDCTFANSHDDPINIHGTFTRVEERIDDNTLKLMYVHSQQGGFPQYHVGDKVVFYTRDTLVSTDREKEYTVSEVLNPGENGNNLKTSIVKFEERLPQNLADKVYNEPKYVAENITYAPKVTIKNNTFKHVSTRGILCTTRNPVLIEGNTFLNMNMASIFLSNDASDWYESGPIRDMTIRKNTFYIREKPRLVGSNDEVPAILIRPITKGGGLPDASNPIHKNITIDENTFYMNEDNVVNAASVENLKITNNKILRYNNEVDIKIEAEQTTMAIGTTSSLKTTATGKQNTDVRDNVYELNKCKNILIEGNTYDDGLKLNAVVHDDETKSTLTINDPQIKIVSDRNQPAKQPVSNIKYITSHSEIATVDSEGNITAHKDGIVKVFAYYDWNNTTIKSNEIEITVGKGNKSQIPTDLIIFNDDDDIKSNEKEQVFKDNYTKLEGINIPELNINETTSIKSNYHFVVEKDKKLVTLEFLGSDRIGTIKLYHGDKRTPVELTKTGNTYSANVSLTSGLDSYFIETIAKDEITKGKYAIHFVRKASFDATVSDISIGEETIQNFSPEKLEYNYTMLADETTLPLSVTPNDINATVSITVNSKRSEGTVREISGADLREGLNEIIIAIKADNRLSNQYYKINVIRSTATNANLIALDVIDHNLSPVFNQNQTRYQVSNNTGSVTISAIAQEENAKITVYSRNDIYNSSTNAITQEVNVYKGENIVTVKVVAPDNKTEKIYTINIIVSEEVYLSELNWEAESSSGYGKITKNNSVENAPIKLATKSNSEDFTGAPVTYEKGIGANAYATIIYNIEGKGFTRFQTYVGVDYANYNADYGSIIFQVFLDDSNIPIFDSGIMRQKTPQQKIDIDVTGVEKLTLKALQVDNNYNDHADWADAKFTKMLPHAPIDKIELINLIASTDAYKQEDYTSESWIHFSEVLEFANMIVEKSDATQQEIDNAVERLNSAIGQLSEVEIVVEKPSNLKSVEITNKSVELSWSNPNYTEGLVGYEIYKDGKVLEEIDSNIANYVAEELKSNTIYGFKVVSKYSNGKKSKPVSVNIRTKK